MADDNAFRRSRIPLPPSRIPRPPVRPAPSREALKEPSNGLPIPRLRPTPSREQLPRRTNPTARESSTGTVIHTPSKPQLRPTPSDDGLFKKPLARPPSSHQEQFRPSSGRSEILQEQDGDDGQEGAARARKSRPSLSERTMETLAQIPPSPASARRRSSFFNPESPMRPPSRSTQGSRPGSSYQTDLPMRPPSRSSRPGSSAGQWASAVPIDLRASTSSFQAPPARSGVQTPVKAGGLGLRTPRSTASLRSSVSKLPSPNPRPDRSPSPVKPAKVIPPVRSGSKTLAARPLKPRASVTGLFKKPSMAEIGRSAKVEQRDKKLSPTFSSTSSEGVSATSAASKDSFSSIDSVQEQAISPRKTSMTLREQIANAKAAKKAQMAKEGPGLNGNGAPMGAGDFDMGVDNDDPFNQAPSGPAGKGLLKKRIDAARTDGRLNIAAMGLKEIPAEVMNMYSLESMNGGSWAESVDMTRLIAADNELTVLGEDVFPDVDPRAFQDDDDSKGNQFGGLETLDLHGNMLAVVPVGLRRLELLTTLNLSNNKLGNDCFEVISQIVSLRDLRLGNNALAGTLSPEVLKLAKLEVLDIQKNKLTALPDGLQGLFNLRILTLTSNALTSIPYEALVKLPLVELAAASNQLSGTLFGNGDIEFSQLQILDVSGNSLMQLGTDLRMPKLHQLSCSGNRLQSLPDVTSWHSLITLVAEGNRIAEIPAGFVELPKLRNADLTSNDIRILDDRIALMESLEFFQITGNPLREKRFASMTIADLKKNMRDRLAPAEVEADPDDTSDAEFHSVTSSPNRTSLAGPSASEWPVKAGGVLDRSGTQLAVLDPAKVENLAATNAIYTLHLHHNLFRELPRSIELIAETLTSLNLSHNELASDSILTSELRLPGLKELNVSFNSINSLESLIAYLSAPSLNKLDVSFNRLTTLPPLRPHFPALSVLLASKNSIQQLLPEAIEGIRVVDCSSNDLDSLNPRIGLLGGPGGLERLDVGGNRFRVPKYTVLDKGTEATLAWLRDRIPVEELPPAETNPGDVD